MTYAVAMLETEFFLSYDGGLIPISPSPLPDAIIAGNIYEVVYSNTGDTLECAVRFFLS